MQQQTGGREDTININTRIHKYNPYKLKTQINSNTKQTQSFMSSRKESILSTKDYFNSFLSDNNIYLSNKLDILLDVVELSQYMHEVNRLCSISFDQCDEFIKNPDEDFIHKLKEIKTKFMLDQIETAKEKLKANSNNLEELIKILEIFNFYFNSENHNNIDLNSIFISLEELQLIIKLQNQKEEVILKKKNKLRLTKKKNKKTKAKNKKTKKKNKKT